MGRSPSTHRTRTTRADTLAGATSSAASTVTTSSRETRTTLHLRLRLTSESATRASASTTPEDRRLDGAKLRPAVPCGEVVQPAAHLVNPPHRLAVGHEQQDGA